MTVAEYIGWETTELRPVSRNSFVRLCTSIYDVADLARYDGGDRL